MEGLIVSYFMFGMALTVAVSFFFVVCCSFLGVQAYHWMDYSRFELYAFVLQVLEAIVLDRKR